MAKEKRQMFVAWLVFVVLIVQNWALPTCPSSNDLCQCVIGAGLELHCPTYDSPEITVHIEELSKDNYRLEIECTTSNDTIYTKLPQIEYLGDAKYVKFKSCPMPASGTPISRILERLGIQRTISLSLSTSRPDDYIVRQHLSGLKNLTKLGITGFTPLENHDDFLDDVANITHLDFRKNTNIRPRMFEKLTELSFLDLGVNIKHLDNGIFSNQKKLHILNLWGNKLHNLTKETFRGMTSDIQLDLSRNELKSLQPDVFHHLVNMEFLSLNSNNFSELPNGLFERTKKLGEFQMVFNREQIKKLPNKFLANLPLLRNVTIQCNLMELSENIFENSDNLTKLILKDNQLAELPGKMLQTQVNLIEIDLSNNRLTSLDEQIFRNTAKIRILNLSKNNLRIISR